MCAIKFLGLLQLPMPKLQITLTFTLQGFNNIFTTSAIHIFDQLNLPGINWNDKGLWKAVDGT
jgi:hypothetical protein